MALLCGRPGGGAPPQARPPDAHILAAWPCDPDTNPTHPPIHGVCRLGLDVPLFNRLLSADIPSLLLDEQYRMHPAIAAFPSARWYGGRVRSGVTAEERPPVQVGGRCREAGAYVFARVFVFGGPCVETGMD